MPDQNHTETIHKPGLSTRQSLSRIEKIIELARWAPSGDNTQPWRFEVVADDHLVIHGFDTRDHCVYDLRGRGSQIAIGALLETIRIAAQHEGLSCQYHRHIDLPETKPTFDIRFRPEAGMEPDPLFGVIESRVTQRRPMKSTPLTQPQRTELQESVGPDHEILWLQGKREKLKVAVLLFKNAYIRLTIPEAYLVHKQIIQWRARYSQDRIPDQALGLDPIATRLMQWAMHSWKRVQFMNRWLAGTLLPRIQLDFVPALRCAGHFLILAQSPPTTLDDFVEAGRALQRFWLTAAKLGLLVQPELTPLIFSSYVKQQVQFTDSAKGVAMAQQLCHKLADLIGHDALDRSVFMGRIGNGNTPKSRSIRLPVETLLRQPRNASHRNG